MTGSWVFGGVHADSDFDLWTVYGQPVLHWLDVNGWVRLWEVPYKDSNTEAVYKKGRVHLQLVYSVARKRKVQDAILEHVPNFHQMTKLDQATVWNLGNALS